MFDINRYLPRLRQQGNLNYTVTSYPQSCEDPLVTGSCQYFNGTMEACGKADCLYESPASCSYPVDGSISCVCPDCRPEFGCIEEMPDDSGNLECACGAPLGKPLYQVRSGPYLYIVARANETGELKLFRYTLDGELDTGFATCGLKAWPLALEGATFTSGIVNQNELFLAVNDRDDNSRLLILPLNETGELREVYTPGTQIHALAVQDNRLAYTGSDNGQFLLASVPLPLVGDTPPPRRDGVNTGDTGYALLALGSGQILVAGQGEQDAMVRRFEPLLSVSLPFGDAGVVRDSFDDLAQPDTDSPESRARALLYRGDWLYVAGGLNLRAAMGEDPDLFVRRYRLDNGEIDSAFRLVESTGLSNGQRNLEHEIHLHDGGDALVVSKRDSASNDLFTGRYSWNSGETLDRWLDRYIDVENLARGQALYPDRLLLAGESSGQVSVVTGNSLYRAATTVTTAIAITPGNSTAELGSSWLWPVVGPAAGMTLLTVSVVSVALCGALLKQRCVKASAVSIANTLDTGSRRQSPLSNIYETVEEVVSNMQSITLGDPTAIQPIVPGDIQPQVQEDEYMVMQPIGHALGNTP